MSCTPERFDAVADYVDGLLAPLEAADLERHLVVCQHCRADVDEQRALVARMRSVSVDSARRDRLIAGLLDLGELPTRPCLSGHAPGPMTVTSGAPPQYVSARRSVGFAVVAFAGCAGIAMVAAQLPAPTTPTTGVVNQQVATTGGPAVVGADYLGSRTFVQVAGYQARP